VIRNHTAEIAAQLAAAYPAWKIWTVPRAVGGTTWCAHRHGDEKHVLNAASPDGLSQAIEQEEDR
jgi:hypothetical protein